MQKLLVITKVLFIFQHGFEFFLTANLLKISTRTGAYHVLTAVPLARYLFFLNGSHEDIFKRQRCGCRYIFL